MNPPVEPALPPGWAVIPPHDTPDGRPILVAVPRPRPDSDPADPAADWQDSAACAEIDPDLWFPEKGGPTREAKTICRMCDVRQECLDAALEADERYGIWGGLSERERRRLKRGRDGA